MRQFTKTIKEQREKDLLPIYTINNSQYRKNALVAYTAHADRLNHYRAKWEDFLLDSETPAQKRLCEDVLRRVDMMTAAHASKYETMYALREGMR